MIDDMTDGGDEAARGLRALGIAHRRHDLIRHLMRSESDEVTTAELMAASGASHTTVRHHLEALTTAGYITQRHSPQPNGRGLIVYWKPDRDGLEAACRAVLRSVLGD